MVNFDISNMVLEICFRIQNLYIYTHTLEISISTTERFVNERLWLTLTRMVWNGEDEILTEGVLRENREELETVYAHII